jgi:hypothetical protein
MEGGDASQKRPVSPQCLSLARYHGSFRKLPPGWRQDSNGPTRQGLCPARCCHVEVVASEKIGLETVRDVSNLYKYYLAYQMIEEQRAEIEKAKGAVKKESKAAEHEPLAEIPNDLHASSLPQDSSVFQRNRDACAVRYHARRIVRDC